MAKLRDQMALALANAAAAAVEQGRTSELRSVPAEPAAQPDPEPTAAPAPTVAEAPPAPVAEQPVVAEPAAPASDVLAAFDRPRAAQAGDLVQFGFRCPRDLKREAERFCFERDVTLQEFGQAALRFLLDELQRRSGAPD